MTQRIEPLSCKAIFMIFRQSSFQSFLDDPWVPTMRCMLWSVVVLFATGFSALVVLDLYRAQLLPQAIPTHPARFFHGFFEFSIFWIELVSLNSLALSCFGFSIANCYVSFRWAAVDISGHKWSGLVVAWIFASRLPRHIYPSGCLHLMLWTAWNESQIQIGCGRHQCSKNCLLRFLATRPK